jgi:hypothetical protein
MKKLITMVALAAISFGSVYAHGTTSNVKSTMQTDTSKKKKIKPMKKDSTKKKDSTVVKQK